MIGALLLSLARSRWLTPLIGALFVRHSHWLPVRRVRETDRALAFWHPRPAYRIHLLIVPKQALVSLADLAPGDPNPAGDMLALARCVAQDLDLGSTGYRLILNGGAFQDVPQLHLHLIAPAPGVA